MKTQTTETTNNEAHVIILEDNFIQSSNIKFFFKRMLGVTKIDAYPLSHCDKHIALLDQDFNGIVVIGMDIHQATIASSLIDHIGEQCTKVFVLDSEANLNIKNAIRLDRISVHMRSPMAVSELRNLLNEHKKLGCMS